MTYSIYNNKFNHRFPRTLKGSQLEKKINTQG